MKINRHGKARILTPEEILRFFEIGCKNSRDQSLYALCLYTGCRISEARQMHQDDAYFKGTVSDTITLRKRNTKGKLSTRTIATHPNLAKILAQYHSDSQELVKLKRIQGNWHHSHLSEEFRAVCPNCKRHRTNRNGSKGSIQRYKCLNCGRNFRERIDNGSCTFNLGKQTFPCSEANDLNVDLEQDLTFSEEPLGFNYPLLEKIPVISSCYFGIEHSASFGLLFDNPDNKFLFPGRNGKDCISETVVGNHFTNACERVEIVGAGTHSLRRTTLTTLHKKRVPLRVIQEISGHRRLSNLQTYIEVDDIDLDNAIDSLL